MLNLDFSIAIPRAIENLQDQYKGPIENFADASAEYLADAYRFYIIEVGAVDTREFLESVHVEQGTTSMDSEARYVVAPVIQAGVIEFGWTERARGQASYPARHPAGKAVEYFMRQLYNGNLLYILNIRATG